jgi:hypothetical protein
MMEGMYRKHRQYGCRITDDLIYKGYRSLLLENECLLIHLLLDKGSEPVRWLHKPTDTDLIWHTRMGLLPKHSLYSDYQMSYLGGWQEMLPEVSQTHVYRGATLQRGETAITPWAYRILKDTPEEIQVCLVNRLRSLPIVVEKIMTVRQGSASVRLDERIVNESPASIEVNWGHHLAYGAPFLDRATRVELGSGSTIHHPESGESWSWPEIHRNGEPIDLSVMAAPGAQCDLLYIKPEGGEYRLRRQQDGLALQVRWDEAVWPYLWYWQNFNADPNAPFFACEYNIGLEMFNVTPKLTVAEAAQNGMALVLPPEGSRRSWLEIDILTGGN